MNLSQTTTPATVTLGQSCPAASAIIQCCPAVTTMVQSASVVKTVIQPCPKATTVLSSIKTTLLNGPQQALLQEGVNCATVQSFPVVTAAAPTVPQGSTHLLPNAWNGQAVAYPPVTTYAVSSNFLPNAAGQEIVVPQNGQGRNAAGAYVVQQAAPYNNTTLYTQQAPAVANEHHFQNVLPAYYVGKQPPEDPSAVPPDG
ncbi:unnamed protein product [Gongylonema pulchrum]|uniref:Protein muscleblind n=1 Tax=Gongylonema pulchrum TaxID=637853 RepID=A0A183DNC5_9BILA|nr:unnamed protein product [Gongylonema pulchrum]